MTIDIEEVISLLKREYKKYKQPIVSRIKEISKDPYKILISTIISLRTKDAVTETASIKLFGLASTPSEMIKLKAKQIEKAIYPAGFYRNKALSIIEVSKKIIEKHRGRVPDNLEELLQLKGVGRKTANLVLSLGYNIPAICVDTHVHRISNRLKVVRTKTPEETEYALMKILKKKDWIIYNDILVTWGQNICRPVNPKCVNCVLNDICKFGKDKKNH
ncbi:MAG: endonuclease III [bacterium (Candidatus Stahlbacteria) CG23_combo_of_CG06-09_8_20_14_all_34_7]|nr:MAG: endonuclease III [bacterium (Candidatus Stahlbacteria) CG23_combo_of_CG06-09_8_20_14_all_34_7]